MNAFTNIRDLPLSTSRPSDLILDATNLMRVVAEILSRGSITDDYADKLSWLLGSCEKRLEPLSELFNILESAGAIEMTQEGYRVSEKGKTA